MLEHVSGRGKAIVMLNQMPELWMARPLGDASHTLLLPLTQHNGVEAILQQAMASGLEQAPELGSGNNATVYAASGEVAVKHIHGDPGLDTYDFSFEQLQVNVAAGRGLARALPHVQINKRWKLRAPEIYGAVLPAEMVEDPQKDLELPEEPGENDPCLLVAMERLKLLDDNAELVHWSAQNDPAFPTRDYIGDVLGKVTQFFTKHNEIYDVDLYREDLPSDPDFGKFKSNNLGIERLPSDSQPGIIVVYDL